MKPTHLIIVSFFVLAQNATFAQNDSVPTIKITANSPKSDILQNKNDNFYDNLRLQTDITLKQYGVNNIANLRLRGLSAEQTVVTWNGMPLNSPMLGQTDISLLPTAAFSSVAINETATGGSLDLKTNANRTENSVFIQYNTAKNINASVSFGLKPNPKNGRQHQSHFTFYGKNDENRFTFLPYGNAATVTTLPHAAQKNGGAMLNYSLRLRDSSEFAFASWTNYTDRSLPPTLSEFADEKASKRQQLDVAQRTTLAYTFLRKQADVTLGHSYEILDYSDSTTLLFAQSKANRFFAGGNLNIVPKIENKRFFGFETHLNYSFDNAFTSTYRNKQQVCGTLKNVVRFRPNTAWQTWVAHQNTTYNEQVFFDAAQYAAGFDAYKNLRKGSLDAHISHARSRRLPTLNERFWQPGGKPDLLPETIIGTDFALNYERPLHQNVQLSLSAKAFWITNDAHIQWLPENGIFAPQNVGKVQSKGASLSANMRYKSLTIKDLYSDFKINYTFINTNNEDNVLYKNVQSIYIPQQQANAFCAIGFRQIRLFAQANYTGVRNTTSDGTQFLAAYTLVDSGIAYVFRTQKSGNFALSLQANNLTNTKYQVTQNYAQPLRSAQIGLRYGHF